MGLRDRREKRRDERETFGRRGTAQRYQMRQKLISIGDDYWIENDAGDRVFRVDGKAMRLRNTLDLVLVVDDVALHLPLDIARQVHLPPLPQR